MKRLKIYINKLKVLNLITGIVLLLANNLTAQIGYYDAPYTRYEADLGTLSNGAVATSKSYDQTLLQSEASDQICVTMSTTNATVNWTVSAAGDGLVVRYSVPDGQSALLDVYANNVNVGTLTLTSYWSWESLWNNGDPNNNGVSNQNPKMRFDEVRMKLPSQILAGQSLKLVRNTGNISLDFAELEPIPAAVTAASGDVTYDGSGLQNFINANGGKTIFLPAGTYPVNTQLWFGVNNTTLKGAGMWYTEINFTNTSYNTNGNQGGLWGQASNISYSGLYLTTQYNIRTGSYKAINGVYSSGSTITNVWAVHFECGAWIAQYNYISGAPVGPGYANGFNMSYCRFRNNYADGTNLCAGTSNAIVEHCSYRNNGDDDMAVWPQSNNANQEGQGNTFRYNTAENSWRASGCAIYGGYNNQAHHLLIKDNLEAGLRANNQFGGYAFNTGGTNQFYNIKVINGGTNNDLFNSPVGAIDLLSTSNTGNIIYNVTFSCIELVTSKNDAIDVAQTTGAGYNNLVFQNITITGTGAEYPSNGGAVGGRGYYVNFIGNPGGSGTYCGMSYSNRGGSATTNTNGSFSWSLAGSCPAGCTSLSSSILLTSPSNGSIYDECSGPVTITASATAPSGSTVTSVDFLVDGTTINTDNSSPYSYAWSSPTNGSHVITAVAHYSNSTTATSSAATVTGAIIRTSAAPTIDGTIDVLWNNYGAVPMNNYNLPLALSGPNDLAATYQLTYDLTNLYILVNVTDDILWTTATNTWDRDGVEIFIDKTNSKTATYGATDFQYGFLYTATTGTTFTAPNAGIISYNSSPVTNLAYADATKSTPNGYIMEIRIPWSTIGGFPAAGSYMGFDVSINDNDNNNGGVRSHQLSWNDASFTEYNNPSKFGTVMFSSCAPLPIDLLSFTGEVMNETVALNWITTAEKNNAKFIIERSSNASDWEAIGEVAGKGNTTFMSNYGFIDYTPPNGLVYYRLRQVDLNGAFTYSNVVDIQAGTQSANVSIMPNPFEDALSITSNIKGNMDISIHDMLGRLLFHTNQKTENGGLYIQPELTSGAYIVTVQTDAFVKQQKVIKK
jgi:hypothetical protein